MAALLQTASANVGNQVLAYRLQRERLRMRVARRQPSHSPRH